MAAVSLYCVIRVVQWGICYRVRRFDQLGEGDWVKLNCNEIHLLGYNNVHQGWITVCFYNKSRHSSLCRKKQLRTKLYHLAMGTHLVWIYFHWRHNYRQEGMMKLERIESNLSSFSFYYCYHGSETFSLIVRFSWIF